MSIPIEQVRTGGFTMNYFRFGTGARTMVILPGLSVQSVMGAAEAVAGGYARMAEDFTVYVFDRREELPPVYPIADMAADTAAAFQALGLRDICLFGASQGGMIALVIAIEHPELVHKLVLGSTSSHVQPEQYKVVERWIRLAKARDGVGLYLDFGREIYPPAVFEQYRPMLASAGESVSERDFERFVILAEGIRGFHVTEQLDRIRCPVFVIGVYEDAVLDSDATMEIAERLDAQPSFRLFLYIGYGHAAFDTAPDYREKMLQFFRSGERETE